VGAVFSKRVHVVQIEIAIAQGACDHREIGNREGRARDPEDVGAQVRDLLLDIEVRALHQRHHGDQGGDADRQSEHGERRAQLMRTDRVQRQAKIVRKTGHPRAR
jgi:hypothetical protein